MDVVTQRFEKLKDAYQQVVSNGTLLGSQSKISPSGKFKVTVATYESKEGAGLEHTLTSCDSDTIICKVLGCTRSASQFFVRDGVEWYHAHRNYIAPMFINLETGEEFDSFQTMEGQNDYNFIWIKTNFSLDGHLACAYGCVWGGEEHITFYDITDPMHPKFLPCENKFSHGDVNTVMDSEIKGNWVSNDTYVCEMIYDWENEQTAEKINQVIGTWKFQLEGESMKIISKDITPEYHIIRKNGEFLLMNECNATVQDEMCYKVEKFFRNHYEDIYFFADLPDHQSRLSEHIDLHIHFMVCDVICGWQLHNPTEFAITIQDECVKTFSTLEDFLQFWEEVFNQSKDRLAMDPFLSNESCYLKMDVNLCLYHQFYIGGKTIILKNGKYFTPKTNVLHPDLEPVSKQHVQSLLNVEY